LADAVRATAAARQVMAAIANTLLISLTRCSSLIWRSNRAPSKRGPRAAAGYSWPRDRRPGWTAHSGQGPPTETCGRPALFQRATPAG